MHQFHAKIIERPNINEQKGYIALVKLGIFRDSESTDFIDLLNIYIEKSEQIKEFEDKEKFIRYENLRGIINQSGSIAESIKNFYENVDLDDEKNDELLDKVYEFRVRHSLWSVFRGQDIPDVYIGPIDDGHEISCVDNKFGQWRYSIDIDSFFSELRRIRQDLDSA